MKKRIELIEHKVAPTIEFFCKGSSRERWYPSLTAKELAIIDEILSEEDDIPNPEKIIKPNF